jgi:superfamily II DNA helicase RecQ
LTPSPSLEAVAFPSRPQINEVSTTEVLPLTTVPIYSRKKIYEGLKKVLNQEEPAFRSDKQREAVFAVINQQSLLIIILPTRGEKTLIFTLPAVL